MQVTNPLVPSPVGSANSASALVANAPSAPDSSRHETPRPVHRSSQGDRARSDDRGGERRSGRRGRKVNISV